ncbi:MAG: TolC family protein [Burkholderiales bacterium]
MHYIVLAFLALGGLLPIASTAQTLKDAVDGAWARQPLARGVAARHELFRARHDAADALFPAPPSIGFSHRSDQIDRNRGARELGSEVAFPLWTSGAKIRGIELVGAERSRFDAEIVAAQWRVAGDVRDSLWQARLSENDRAVATGKLAAARLLADDVARRVSAGDLAPVDAHLANAAVQLAAASLLAAEGRLARAMQQFRLLTGLARLPEDLEEPRIDIPALDAHPELVANTRLIEAARARLSQVSTVTRDPPELAVGVWSERVQSGERGDLSLHVGVRIPFGTDARNRPRIAEANAELIVASAELDITRQKLESEMTNARAALDTARALETVAAERSRLADESHALYERAFKLGELDLPARLRAENERFDAEIALGRARTEIGHAIARFNQSLGLLP